MDDFGNSRTIRGVRWLKIQHILRDLSTHHYYGGQNDKADIRNLEDLTAIKLRHWLRPLIDLSDMPYAYHINGIHSAIDNWAAREQRTIACLKGEYPYIRNVRSNIMVCDSVDQIPKDAVVYLSNPFSATGNYEQQYFNIQNPMVLDLAYVGTTDQHSLPVRENVEAIFWSASKSFGLGNFKTGYYFSRLEHQLNKQLKDAGYSNWFAISLLNQAMNTAMVFENYKSLYNQYDKICERNGLIKSNSYLIARSTADKYPHLIRDDGTVRVSTGTVLDRICYLEGGI